jgi:50S ribosomal subunit-associated GTPase HflX
LIAANKMDIPDAGDNLKALQQRFPDRKIVPISAKENDGLEALKGSFEQLLLQPENEASKR